MENWCLAAFDALMLAFALYGIGYLVLRLCNIRRLWALACAPLVSIAVFFVLTTLYAGAIPATYATLVGAPFIVLLLAYAVRSRTRFTHASTSFRARSGQTVAASARAWFRSSQGVLFASICVSTVLFLLIYVRMAGDGANYAWLLDNSHHMSTALALTEKTNWSVFNPWAHTYYATGVDPLGEHLGASAFYPPVWQWLVALPATLVPQNIAIAQNGLLALTCAVMAPLSFFALSVQLFGERLETKVASVVTPLSFFSFPWLLMVWGPLYPNLFSYVLVLPCVIAFLQCFAPQLSWPLRLAYVLLVVVGAGAIFLTQPNGVFVFGTFVAPFLVWQISRIPQLWMRPGWVRGIVRTLFALLAIAFVLLTWWVIVNSSFMADVRNFDWPAFVPDDQAWSYLLTAHFAVGYTLGAGPQYLLASFVIVGLVAALAQKQTRWLAASYAAFAFLYGVCVASKDPNKWIVTGFWYNDSFRLSAAAALAGVPVATLGLATFAKGVAHVFGKESAKKSAAVFLATLATFAAVNFWASPWFSPAQRSGNYPLVSADLPDNDYPMGYPFQRMEYLIARGVNPTYMKRVAQKRAFMRHAAAIAQDGFVMNNPSDGSMFGYPCEGLSTLVRSYASTPYNNDLLADTVANIDHIATNHNLATRLHNAGVNYLIRLENDGAPRVAFTENPDYATWHGFYHVSANTPGFEQVLAENGMELYRIRWDEIL